MNDGVKLCRIPGAILYDSRLTPAEKVLLGLAWSFPDGLRLSNAEIGRILCKHQVTVSRIIKKLEADGWLKITGNQSRWRRIYFNNDVKVKDGDTLAFCDSTLAFHSVYFSPHAKQNRRIEKEKKESTPFSPVENTLTDVLVPSLSTQQAKQSSQQSRHRQIHFGDAAPKAKITPEEFIQHWNRFDALPAIRAFSKERRSKLAARAKEDTFKTHWREIIRKLAGSPFHIGQNDRGWRAGIDWILKNETNYLKILELPEPTDGMTGAADGNEIITLFERIKNG